MTQEVLKLALEALEDWCCGFPDLIQDMDTQAIAAIKEALAQPQQEPVAWKNAAIRLGEELSSVGPDGYYEMTAEHWLDWAMEQKPRGKNSLTQPQQEPVYKYCADGKVIFTNPEILSRRPNKE